MALNNEFKVKNDLNTLGRILSGGTDITTIFSPSNTSWTLSANNGTFGVAGGDTLSVQGGNGVDVRVATGTDTIRISGIDATASVKGVASFSSDNFAVTGGVVTVKDGGIVNAELATASSSNLANNIVVRGASGEFSSGSITATGNLSASGTVTGNAVVASNITATNLLSAANTFTRQLSVGNVQVRTVGTSNVFIGDSTTGRDAATGDHNFVFGLSAGNALTSGCNSVFIGECAGRVNSSGNSNNFLGFRAGFNNTTGGHNNFFGYNTGRCNTTGCSNNFLGQNAGQLNTGGNYNNFLGLRAGFNNTTGCYNNFFGRCAGHSNDTGDSNNFFGSCAGRDNTTGDHNNFLSFRAGLLNNTGNNNNFLGRYAGSTNTIGSNNTIIGNRADVATDSLSGVIVLGTGAVATESHQIVLSTANVVFKNTGSTFEIGTPSLTDNLTVYGAVSSTGIVNTNTGFRISNGATSGHVLRGNGTNFVSSTLAASDIASGQALTKADDTNVTLTLSGTPGTALLKNVGLTLGWSGQLAQARGGTGSNNGSITGTSNLIFTATGSNNIDLVTSTGEVNIGKVDIDSGTIDGVTIGGTTVATSISSALLNVDNIRIDGNAITSTNTNGNIDLTPNGSGEVNITKVDIDSGTIDGVTIATSTASLTLLDVDNIRIDANTISSTNSNGDIVLAPNGTGDVQLDADTVRVGDSGVAATVTTNGAGNLTLNTNGGTSSGTITINQGANGNIDLTPNGTGSVVISKADINGGTIDGVSIGSASVATYLKVDTVAIDNNSISFGSGAAQLTFLGSGNLSHGTSPGNDFISIGSAGIQGNLTGPAGADLVIGTNYNDSSRSRITLDEATNGNITFGLNGTGSVVIPRADINAGTIDNTTIGLTVPASGVFTGVNVTGNVTIDGNLFVAGSATQFNTQDLVIQDPIIFLAEGNLNDSVDIGFTAAYNHSLTPPRHTGFIRDHVTKEWTLFSNLSSEILSAIDIPLTDPSLQVDTLNANIKGTLTGNVSGTALRANQFTTGKIISATGDISYSSGSFDGSVNVTGTATINNNAVTTAKILDDNVTYAKIQNVTASDRILGRSTAGAGIIEEITCTAAGRALLDDASASVQRVTLGLGPTNSVTFGEVVVNNGTKSVLNDVYNTTTATNVATLSTFANASYNSAKYTVQIKNTTTSARCALEIIATKNNTTWEGTVYGIVDPANIFFDVQMTTGPTAELSFTLNGVANYAIIAYTQAISD